MSDDNFRYITGEKAVDILNKLLLSVERIDRVEGENAPLYSEYIQHLLREYGVYDNILYEFY